MKNKKSIAFTLAEVLMVLVIIGIIATMTIPSLVRSNEKIQYVVALKKFYATTNQALIKMAMDGGCIGDLSCFFDIKKPAGFTNANSGMGDKIVSYYKVAKNCKTADNQECWAPSNVQLVGGQWTFAESPYFPSMYKFTTMDGMNIAIDSATENCNWTTLGIGHMAKVCGEMYVDVNGLKKPNRFGRDIFPFYISNGRGPLLYPASGMEEGSGVPDGVSHWKFSNTCDETGVGDGFGCIARIIEDSWQMNY